ncbi:MAG: diphosphate--fructose-6-phosphate 1-phosphotransferase [Verrucomicrobiota bacterium]|nr:diphosphate--fructose-6-phosphate 1-phosphotransferase [Verrucomicrobiota bacterium]
MISPLEKKRLSYVPQIPPLLKNIGSLSLEEVSRAKAPVAELKSLFPRIFSAPSYRVGKGKGKAARAQKVGVLFSGGPAAGGHNVLAGLFDALKELNSRSQLIGFLNGAAGVLESHSKELSAKMIDGVRNLGGFDLIGSGRTKIETAEQLAAAAETVRKYSLDALVIIGGDDSNTNAAVLAEYFLQHNVSTRVIGVPKTIDGDLRSQEIELSFGFDSACKTYAELIGNIARDAKSSRKYYHFIKLMGRSASHITLECALATHPNLALVGEERKTLAEIVRQIADLVRKRKQAGKEYGVILVPEGLIEFMPEVKQLISELNKILAEGKPPAAVESLLADAQRQTFRLLPEKIQQQLLFDRDPHGNVQVSQIATEELLIELVKRELKDLKWSAQPHFFGYEGRCCLPSNFDANYGYALGRLAALAIKEEVTGVICAIQFLAKSPEKWALRLVSIIQLMCLEMRKGKQKPVIQKALVDIKGKVFAQYQKVRSTDELEDRYRYPGPIQFFDPDVSDSVPLTLER